MTVVPGWIAMERPSADVIILDLLGRHTGVSDVSSNMLQVDEPGRRASYRYHCVLEGQLPVAVLPASAATASSAARWIASLAR